MPAGWSGLVYAGKKTDPDLTKVWKGSLEKSCCFGGCGRRLHKA